MHDFDQEPHMEGVLRQAIDRIRSEAMPADTLQRALERAEKLDVPPPNEIRIWRRLLTISGAAAAAVILCITYADKLLHEPTGKFNTVAQSIGGGTAFSTRGHEYVDKPSRLMMDSYANNGGPGNVDPKHMQNLAGGDIKAPADQPPSPHNTEAYDFIVDNEFRAVKQRPLSTFASDVDTASYAIVRRFLTSGQMPPKDAVRIEEMINYFPYDYPPPKDNKPFAAHVAVADCPWKPEHRLVRIGLKGKVVAEEERPASNLVFLIDVSGSMAPLNRLPLIQRALPMLVERLSAKDRVAIVVYAGASGLVLPSTPGTDKQAILAGIANLGAGGSTNGGAGIELAYRVAQENFIKGGINRVILATDGDFNVGATNQGDLVRLIQDKAKSGVFLTVLGFGYGNLKDSTLEKLADKGNGNYAYIDTLNEARKVLVEQMHGTLMTIAKDVKIQVEFNPAQVRAYRLIGYENRLLRAEDFKDDKKDAGEIGAGHTVTALYEIVPDSVKSDQPDQPAIEPLKYQKPARPNDGKANLELLTVKLRYKEPDGDTSQPLEYPVVDSGTRLEKASDDFRFAAAVAGFGMLLRDSKFKGNTSYAMVRDLARNATGHDLQGYRAEFLKLIDLAEKLSCK